MINLLRGDFFKLRKSKAFYVCIIVIIAFVLFTYGIYLIGDKVAQQQAEQQVADGNVQFKIEVSEEAVKNALWDNVNVVDMTQMMFNVCSTLATAIFASIFVYADYAGGALKNIVGKGYARWKIFLSKFMVTNAAVLIIQIIMVFAVWILMVVFAGPERITAADYSNLLKYTLTQMLLGIAWTAIMMVINQFCRNLGMGIAICVSILFFSQVISSGIDLILKYLKSGVKFSDYWIPELIGNCPTVNIEGDILVRIVLSSVVWLVIALVAGTIHFQKADVK